MASSAPAAMAAMSRIGQRYEPATGDTAAPATPTTPTSTAPPIVTSLGAYADHESLANVRPANPSTILLTVFNASSVRGQAKAVADELRAAGFESMLASGNDPLYPASDLNCVAQIRFGPAGAAAARLCARVRRRSRPGRCPARAWGRWGRHAGAQRR